MSKSLDIETVTLKSGYHRSRAAGVCAMEAVAWLAGEKHSDHPACASPVIATFIRNWNDSLPSDDDRNRLLKPLLPRLIGTAADAEIEARRSWMAMDWSARECAPAFLALTPALMPHADALRALAPLTDESLAAARQILAAAGAAARDAARDAAWDAARAAARDAAWDAARAAAWDAARAAAWDAARAAAGDAAWNAARAAAGDAAWDAARAAARDAARDAAWDAARAAAGDALRPTVERLQESAQHLVIRMCELTAVSHD